MKTAMLVVAAVALYVLPSYGQDPGVKAASTPGLQATDVQREHYRACTKTANGVREQARLMVRMQDRKFNTDEVRRQRDQIRQQFQKMEQEHEQLMQSLRDEQKAQVQPRMQMMENSRQHARTHLAELDRELDGNVVVTTDVRARAREFEGAMKEWQKRHRQMGSEIGLS